MMTKTTKVITALVIGFHLVAAYYLQPLMTKNLESSTFAAIIQLFWMLMVWRAVMHAYAAHLWLQLHIQSNVIWKHWYEPRDSEVQSVLRSALLAIGSVKRTVEHLTLINEIGYFEAMIATHKPLIYCLKKGTL